MISSPGYSFMLRLRELRGLGRCGGKLSGFGKFQFVAFVLGIPIAVVTAVLCTMASQQVTAAVQTFLGVYFANMVVGVVRGSREPQPRAINRC